MIERRSLLTGAVAGAVSLLPGCGPSVNPAAWSTQTGAEYVLPQWHWAPKTARELVEAVKRAEQEGRRIRMTGSGHSFSDVAISGDWLLAPTGLARSLCLDSSQLRPEVSPNLVRVASGLRIRELNTELEQRGLALQNMGGWDEQTYVGAAMTGTHGSGLAFGPLASQIVSILVVGPGGKLTQYESTVGVSDPAKFPAPLPEDHGLPVSLVQDDDTFNALAVGLGCLGVIYSVTFRAVPKFWLVERRTFTSWEALTAPGGKLTRLIAGRPLVDDPSAPAPDHVEVYFTPYAEPHSGHAALLTERWRTTVRPPGAGEMVRGAPWFATEEFVTYAFNEADILEPIFAGMSTSQVRRLHTSGFRNMAQDYYADISYRVFSTGLLNKLRFYGVEPAFTLEQTTRAVARVFTIADQLAQSGIRHASPISLRFLGSARAHLAMSNGGPRVMMEIDTMAAAPGAEDLLRIYETDFHRNFGARLHWGLDRNVLQGAKEVLALYPNWTKWHDALQRLNPNGTFDGRFTDRLGISKRQA